MSSPIRCDAWKSGLCDCRVHVMIDHGVVRNEVKGLVEAREKSCPSCDDICTELGRGISAPQACVVDHDLIRKRIANTLPLMSVGTCRHIGDRINDGETVRNAQLCGTH